MQISSRLTNEQIALIGSETSRQIDAWVRRSNLPSYMSQWFKCARDEAFLSDFHTAKLGCVFVYRNHIIGKGHNQNKTDPLQKEYNRKYKLWAMCNSVDPEGAHTLHAELATIKSLSYSTLKQTGWKRVQVYLYRVGIGLEGYSGLALPCEACAKALFDIGIQKVFYTTGRIDKPFGSCDL